MDRQQIRRKILVEAVVEEGELVGHQMVIQRLRQAEVVVPVE